MTFLCVFKRPRHMEKQQKGIKNKHRHVVNDDENKKRAEMTEVMEGEKAKRKVGKEKKTANRSSVGH